MEKKITMKSKRNWLWEFSKKIVWIITIMFVLEFFFASVLIIFFPDSTAIQFVIENISDVFKVTVVSYAVKAGFENVFKIRRNAYAYELDTEQPGDSDISDPGSTRAN